MNMAVLFDSTSQCITTGISSSSGFRFGFFYKATAVTNPLSSIYCEVSFYTASDCATGYSGRFSTMVASDGSSWVPGTIDASVPASILSIGIHCSAAQGTGYLDQFYFSQANNPGF